MSASPGSVDHKSGPDRIDPGESRNCTVATSQPVCPVCHGPLIEIRAKLQCRQCGRICETCCEGGRG